MTPTWPSLIIASLIIASFIGTVFAAKRTAKHINLTEIDDTIIKLLDIADPYQAPKNPTAKIKELGHAYVVIANINGIEVAIKKFPKDYNPQLAKISAEELADEIMND